MLETERLQPVNLVLRKCLYPHISQKYYRVCTRLVQILKEEYRLMGYLAAMRVSRDPIQSTNCCSTLFHILHLIKLFVATNFRDKLKIKYIKSACICSFFQHFFLMEAGDTMFDFYTPIFDKVGCLTLKTQSA